MTPVSHFAPVVILGLGCALLWNAHNQAAMPIAGSLHSVLATVPGLNRVDQTISDQERRVAGMTDYVARVYRRDNAVAFTTFVSYYDRQTQGKTIHSPRNCLPGAGWEIVSGGPLLVRAGAETYSVNRYVLKNGKASAIAYYWYQGRGRVTANEYRVKWNLLRDAAFYGRTEEALARVVVPVRSERAEDLVAADAQAQEVVRKMIPEVAGVLPRIS